MKNLVTFFKFSVWFIASWIFIFQIQRSVFAYFQVQQGKTAISYDFIKAFFWCLRFDISIAFYIFAIPFLSSILYLLFHKKWFLTPALVFTFIILIVSNILAVADIATYKEWGTKITADILQFLKNPKESLASSSTSNIGLLVVLIILYSLVGIFLIHKAFKALKQLKPTKWYFRLVQSLVVFILVVPLGILSVRGGWQLSALNPSFASYSKNVTNNNICLNTTWNFFYTLIEQGNFKLPTYYTDTEINKTLYVKDFKQYNYAFENKILAQKNVVLIIIEGLTADALHHLNGLPNVTPFLDSLAKKSIVFKQCYANAERTYKGIPTCISGYPTPVNKIVINNQRKTNSLFSLANFFNQHSYQSAFYYGGEIEFANIGTYIRSANFGEVITQYDFTLQERNASKWGVFDHVVFNKLSKDVNQFRQPFFATIMTLSNHEPFELPAKPHFQPNVDLPSRYKNTAYYTDSCLQVFFEKNKNASWFQQSVFVITADHGHRLPLEKYEVNRPERFHIPLLLYIPNTSETLANKSVEKYVMQSDIPAIISKCINNQYDFDNTKSDKNTAFYAYNNGFGAVSNSGFISYDVMLNKITESNANTNELEKLAKCWFQQLDSDYFK